jgi:hypothetical protein
MLDGGLRPWEDRVEPDLRRRVLGKMDVFLHPTDLRLMFPAVYLSFCSPTWHPWGQGPSAPVVGLEREGGGGNLMVRSLAVVGG